MRYRVALFLLLIIGFLVSLPEIFSPLWAEGDAYARVIIPAKYVAEGILFDLKTWANPPVPSWLPLHFVLIGVPLFVSHQPQIVPRALTLVFSALSIVALYYYTSTLLTGKRFVALIAAGLFLLFPLRLLIATHPLSESVFLFFFLAALTLLFARSARYGLGLLLLNIAHGIRYESWLVLPLIWWLFFVSRKLDWRKGIMLIGGSVVFPLFWLFLNLKYAGGMFAFFIEKRDFAQRLILPEYGNFSLALTSWLGELVETLGFTGLILVSFGIFFQLRERPGARQVALVIFPLYLFLWLVIQLFLGAIEWLPHRYLLIQTTLALPLAAYGVWRVFTWLRARVKLYFIPLTLLGILFVSFDLFSMTANLRRFTAVDADLQQGLLAAVQAYTDIRRSEPDFVSSYYYAQNNHWWVNHEAFLYFAQEYDIPVRSKEEVFMAAGGQQDRLFIVERDYAEGLDRYLGRFDILYENPMYILLKS